MISAEAVEQPPSESEFSDDDIFIEMLLAENGSFDGGIEQDIEEIYSLIEEDLIDAPEEIILSAIYEETVYDLIEGLSAEELEEVYYDLASI